MAAGRQLCAEWRPFKHSFRESHKWPRAQSRNLRTGALGSSTQAREKTCFFTPTASKEPVSRSYVKGRRCPTRKARVQKARAPKTSSRYSSAGTCCLSATFPGAFVIAGKKSRDGLLHP